MTDIIVKKNKKRKERANVEAVGMPPRGIPLAGRYNHGTHVFQPPDEELFTYHLSSRDVIYYLTDEDGDKQTSGFATSMSDILHVNNEDYEMLASVASAEIPNKWYNVDANNNKLTLQTFLNNETPEQRLPAYSIEIPKGYYPTVEQIIAVINATLPSSELYHFEFGFNTVSRRTTFQMVADNPSFIGAITTIFSFDATDSIGDVLGVNGSVTVLAGDDAVEGDSAFNLNPFNVLFIKTNLTSGNVHHSRTKSKASNILAKIPVAKVAHDDIVEYSRQTDFHTRIHNKHINELVIELVDEKGGLIDLNNSHWTLTLEIIVRKRVIDHSDILQRRKVWA